ncbi:ParB N-terminal domain-containing protein [Limnoglobus roseus]|uniref:ParB-like N-terminal domain-containing protein n=1 Tax=Limnoglobus roseus TaxID=2598579 RepID=A0A5C1AMC6_9BACT|nr:ParB N-terminal domain-containing protein [Limnoglobus roseus]QEL20467.1 hypothetical protein PX52LOC_07568 [Limnoglobus roseus]QEL20569.1 hypothetical protein PX52LOC_07674 [Limnoglobus roseus]
MTDEDDEVDANDECDEGEESDDDGGGPAAAIVHSLAVEWAALEGLTPAAVNDRLYRPVRDDDPGVVALAEAMGRDGGVLEPIVVTLDRVVLSGHRRRAAARLAGFDPVPVRVYPIWSADPAFVRLLRTFNQQRVKTFDEQIREAVIDADPHTTALEVEAYEAERDATYRRRVAAADIAPIAVTAARRRNDISAAKRPMLDAVIRVVQENREYWPLSNRQVHYRLLNDPPLKHARKPGSRYRNDLASYKDLCDVLTRARLAGVVPFDAISDTTRPSTQWRSWGHAQAFVREATAKLLSGYARDPLQSQPAYVEVLVEKLTAETPVERAAAPYLVPYCVGRGYPSLDARYQLAERFRASGKRRFVLLVLSDFDPEGENIAETLCASLRDEFDVPDITPFKVALTEDQVGRFGLVPSMEVKRSSSRAKGFVGKHGSQVYELEALPPARLQQLVTDAIESVLDLGAYRRERAEEARELQELVARRRVLLDAVGGLGGGA